MEYVRIGSSGLVSSVIGLGGGSSSRFGLAKGGTRSDALRLLRMALDEGITFFDGGGLCGGVDELIAEGLAGSRHKVLVSTKVHLGLEPVPLAGTRFANTVSSWVARRRGLVCSGPTLRRRVERTLKSLRTDHVDILHLHAVSRDQYSLAVSRVIPELLKMKDEGKLRATGITEGFLSDPHHAMLRTALSDVLVDTIMVGFNVRNPSAAGSVFPAAAKAGIGVIGMFALRGFLIPSGGAQPAGGADCDRILGEAGITSLTELAFRYCRHQPGMDIVLTGTGDPAHLRQNIAAALAPPLPAFVLDRLRLLSASPEPAQARGASMR